MATIHQNGTCLLYISTLLFTLSNNVQLNPGPRTPKYPCGSCGAAVKNNQNSIHCDGCNVWHHIECQGMNTTIHQIMAEHSSYSWNSVTMLESPVLHFLNGKKKKNCLRCGLPNFSTSFFDDFSTSYCSSNSFGILEASSLSPKTSTPLKKKNAVKRKKKIKIINLNFQSIVNKVPEFHCLIETEKPDIVVGTES